MSLLTEGGCCYEGKAGLSRTAQGSVGPRGAGYRPKIDRAGRFPETQRPSTSVSKRIIRYAGPGTLTRLRVPAFFQVGQIVVIQREDIHVEICRFRILFSEEDGFSRQTNRIVTQP